MAGALGGGSVGLAYPPRQAAKNGCRNMPISGRAFSDDECRAFLDEADLKYESFNDDAKLTETIVEALTCQQVIGFSPGPIRMGTRAPSATGASWPTRAGDDMKEIVNTKIKFREPLPALLRQSYCARARPRILRLPAGRRSRFAALYADGRAPSKKTSRRRSMPSTTKAQAACSPSIARDQFKILRHRPSNSAQATGVSNRAEHLIQS